MKNYKNKSTDEEIKRYLQSIGKRCFINCFEFVYKKTLSIPVVLNITYEDMKKCDPELIGTKETGLATRRSNIIRLFNENNHFVALKNCNPSRIDKKMQEKADKLYKKYY